MSEDRHARPAGTEEEPLYDTNVPTPTHAERARSLVASIGTGALSTIARDPAGYPYGSVLPYALVDGRPVFLISQMAEHTGNLAADGRASLLAAESGGDNPLALGRVALIGTAAEVEEAAKLEAVREIYLARHPNASYYVDFRDFGFWQLDVEALRYIGGYGRMSWVTAADWYAAEPDPMTPHAAGIIEHMNEDHADALVDYCKAFSKAQDVSAASMTGVDRYGFEMSIETPAGRRPVRLAFDTEIATPDDARRELVALVGRARTVLGGGVGTG